MRMVATGVGEITYECREKTDTAGQYEWAFVGPVATLYSADKRKPSASTTPARPGSRADGSKVTGKQVAVSPAAPGNIPLQLVKTEPAMGSGAMTGVTYIQRLNTKGGVAPGAGLRRRRARASGSRSPTRPTTSSTAPETACGAASAREPIAEARRQLGEGAPARAPRRRARPRRRRPPCRACGRCRSRRRCRGRAGPARRPRPSRKRAGAADVAGDRRRSAGAGRRSRQTQGAASSST